MSTCTICGKTKHEGSVCHFCRAAFIPYAVGEPLDCTCLNCDVYGFPCANCAEACFHGMLGNGHLDVCGDNEPMDVDVFPLMVVQ